MSGLGYSVMLHRLTMEHDGTAEALARSRGQTIQAIELRSNDDGDQKDELVLIFDRISLVFHDVGQSCCEFRYMHTDDDLTAFVGGDFLSAEIRSAPNVPDECEDHEVQFLLVNTSLGTFTIETHIVHNGYYGGFAIIARNEFI